MKKKIFILVVALTLMTLCMAIYAGAKGITVSYVNTQDPTDATTSLDKGAYTDGKQIVASGEEFTLPTTSNAKHAGESGYQLVWYTEDGRTYMAGESVSFNEDTRLYRCVAKEAYNSDELYNGIRGETKAVILMADIERTSTLSTDGRCQNILVLNGHTLTINGNVNGFGNQRTGKHIIGKGTFKLTNPNGKLGEYCVLHCQSHSYDGVQNKSTIGIDVTVDAPTYNLYADGDGAYNGGYPWVRIYGKINVYTIGKHWNGNRQPRIEFFESADVTINGGQLFYDYTGNPAKYNGQKIQLTIYGGTFTLSENAVYSGYWSNDVYDESVHGNTACDRLTFANYDAIKIYGGTFNVKIPDIALTVEGKGLSYNEETGLYSVVDKACTNGAHSYTLAEVYETAERDCITAGIYYYRCECGAYVTAMYDAMGHSYTIVNVEQEATQTAVGIKRVDCDRCDDYYTFEYAFSPADIEVTITVNTMDGQKDITLLAGDVFNFVITEGANYSCVISGIKGGEEYTVSDIVKLTIPSGLMTVANRAISDLISLKEVVTMDYANVTFDTSAFKNCPELEKLTLGNGESIFNASTVSNCPNFAVIDMTNGNATFKENAFKSNKAIKQILMSAGHTYKFGTNSFNSSGLTQVILPDDSDIRFEGDAAFYGCPDLEYAYFGYNCISDKKIYKKPFDCCYSLKTVVLMDIIYIDQYTFCCNGDANSGKDYREGKGLNHEALVVYSHADSISFNENVFANRMVLGVKLYTVNTNISSLKNCAYTVYQGIGHGYTLGTIIPSTCVTQGTGGYITDCPCQIDYRENEYTTYSTMDTSLNEVAHQPFGTEEVALPLSEEHTNSDIVNNVIFKDGYMSKGTKSFKCLYCDVTVSEEEIASFPALFTYLGYSTPVDGKLKLTVGYDVNVEAIGEYKDITGIDLDYGVVAAVYDKLEGKAPFDEALENTPVIKVEVNKSYASFEFVLTGFTEAQLDLALVMCAYVYDGTKYVYLQEVQNDIPASVTIGNYL